MATLQQVVQFTIALASEAQRRLGDKNIPTSLAVTGSVFDTGGVVIADNYGQAVLWQANQGGLASFAYALFIADQDCVLEFANTTPNPDERFLVTIKANAVLVLPSSVLGAYASNTTRLDGAALVAATDYNTINEIRVQRDAADLTADATVRLMLVL